VTGAARGTGAVTARLLVDEGARVVLADVLDDEGEKVAKQLGESALYQHLDVTSEADWQRAVEHTLARFGSLDVLVNNAALLHMAAIDETPLADFQRVINVNQVGPFLGIKWVTAPMRKAGRGSIVNVSSIDGLQGHNGCVAYCASKWAVRGLSQCWQAELRPHDIRVVCICPSEVQTAWGGKAGRNNLGALFIDDEAPGKVDRSGDVARIGAVRYSRDLFRQSSIGVLLTDRELGDGYNRVASDIANIATPVVQGDLVFGSAGYGTGAGLVEIGKNEGKLVAEEIYFLEADTLQNHHGGLILHDGMLYTGTGHNKGFPIAVDFKTGKVAWGPERNEGTSSAAVSYADGRLYFRYQDGRWSY